MKDEQSGDFSDRIIYHMATLFLTSAVQLFDCYFSLANTILLLDFLFPIELTLLGF